MRRTDALKALVGITLPLAEAIANLTEFPWDSDSDLIVLTPDDVNRAFSMFEQGLLTAVEVEAWANAVESREDVGFSSLTVEELIHDLANPLLTEPLTPKWANLWSEKLKAER